MPVLPALTGDPYPPAVAVALFYRACLAVGAGLILLALALRRPLAAWRGGTTGQQARPDPVRTALQSGLGALWLLDGLLQAQPLMVTRFVDGLLVPLTQGQPGAVAAVVRLGIHLWRLSPIWWNVGAAYLQALVGLSLLWGGRGSLARVALWVSVVWSAVVWAMGEAFGGLASGGGPLTGSPGSVLLYGLAAVVLLLDDPWWQSRRWQGVWPAGFVGYFLLMAFLQAWPANGWWTGTTLGGWVQSLSRMPQPRVLARTLSSVAASLQAHPTVWNALLVASTLGLSLGWWRVPRSRALFWCTVAWTVLVWFVGQDFGVLGGLGTDPNTGGILLVFELAWYTGLGAVSSRAPRSAAAGRSGAA